MSTAWNAVFYKYSPGITPVTKYISAIDEYAYFNFTAAGGRIDNILNGLITDITIMGIVYNHEDEQVVGVVGNDRPESFDISPQFNSSVLYYERILNDRNNWIESHYGYAPVDTPVVDTTLKSLNAEVTVVDKGNEHDICDAIPRCIGYTCASTTNTCSLYTQYGASRTEKRTMNNTLRWIFNEGFASVIAAMVIYVAVQTIGFLVLID